MSKSILIVEDEVLIASQIKFALEDQGYCCVGIAINYQQAITKMTNNTVDLVILDINISGPKSGIDLAERINQDFKIPFLYLTSYTDEETLLNLKKTNPQAYLVKPINEAALITTVDLAFSNTKNDSNNIIPLKLGKTIYYISIDELQYIKSDHNYVEIYLTDRKILVRASLIQVIEAFPEGVLYKINRRIAVNPKHITQINKKLIRIADCEFKISKLLASSLHFHK